MRFLFWEDVAFRFLQIAQARYAALITERYSLDAEEVAAMDTYELMQTIGRKRGAIVRGGKVDDLKTAHIIIKDFSRQQNWSHHIGIGGTCMLLKDLIANPAAYAEQRVTVNGWVRANRKQKASALLR